MREYEPSGHQSRIRDLILQPLHRLTMLEFYSLFDGLLGVPSSTKSAVFLNIVQKICSVPWTVARPAESGRCPFIFTICKSADSCLLPSHSDALLFRSALLAFPWKPLSSLALEILTACVQCGPQYRQICTCAQKISWNTTQGFYSLEPTWVMQYIMLLILVWT